MNSHPFKPAFRRRGLLLATVGAGAFLLVRQDAVNRSPGRTGAAHAELDLAARQGELCSPSNAVGVGLRGEYFAKSDCQGPVLLSRIDPIIDFDASLDWPSELTGQTPRSVRWSGWVKPPVTGNYRFHCDAPDTRLLVSKTLMEGGDAPPDAHIELAAGRYFPLALEVRKLTELPGRIRLEWTAPHGARYLIPRQLLHLPMDAGMAAPART